MTQQGETVAGAELAEAVEVLPRPRRAGQPEPSSVVRLPDEGEWPAAATRLAVPGPEPRLRAAHWRRAYSAGSLALDLAAAVAAVVVAICLRPGTATPNRVGLAVLAIAPLWVLLVAANRAYEQRFIGVGGEEFPRLMRAGVLLMAVVAPSVDLAVDEPLGGQLISAVPAVVLLSALGRLGQRSWLRAQRAVGRCLHRAVVIGSEADVLATVRRLESDRSHGIVAVAACLTEGNGKAEAELTGFDVAVYDGADEVEDAAGAVDADLVIALSSALIAGDELRRLAWRLEPLDVDVLVGAGITEFSRDRVSIRPAAHAPLLHLSRARLYGPARIAKGVIDRLGALLGLLLLSPALAVVAFAIWAHDRGSPFFLQTRVGRHGREFRIVKFRTMVADAEARRDELLTRNESDGLLFKIADDPRITPLGRWLRKYSIDELPQLINVVRGDMSLVGPRPPLPDEAAAYGADMRRRLLVKPGMTGLWQVSGRSELSWAETVRLDLRYVENWSLGFDLMILWRTARAVMGGSGAY